jgi:hypothetical protein
VLRPATVAPSRTASRGAVRVAVRAAVRIAFTAPLGLAATVAGCSDTFTPASAAHADQLFASVADRFSPNIYDARYNTARVKLAQSALVPSRIFDDSAVWTARPSVSSRALFVIGASAADGNYRFESKPWLPPITRTGESRHAITLERDASNKFRWDTRVDLGVGAITADEVADALMALLEAPAERTERALRADYRASFPRSMAAFGRGFVLDSMKITPSAPGGPGGPGATSVELRFAFRPELMKPAFPALSEYVDKYLGPAKYRFTVTDRAGATLFDIRGRDRAMTIRYRVARGKLVSLAGPAKPWPDSLRLSADISLKVKFFTVGFHELITDFVISNQRSAGAHERAWTVLAQREPEWDLPLITERLIRSPLRRPFEGPGSSFRLAVRDSAGAQSFFSRRTRLQVQESSIMRFIGSLASHAMGELDDKVEAEEHRFLREGFLALQADARALAGRSGKGIEADTGVTAQEKRR